MYIQIQNNNYTAYQYRLKVKVQVKQSTTIMYILVFSKECFKLLILKFIVYTCKSRVIVFMQPDVIDDNHVSCMFIQEYY